MKEHLKHLVPEKNIICAIMTAVIAVAAAECLEANGASISSSGTTCIADPRARTASFTSPSTRSYTSCQR